MTPTPKPIPQAVPPIIRHRTPTSIAIGKPDFRPAISPGLAREVLGVLLQGRDRLVRGWTQCAHARNKTNTPVHPESEEAVCWCYAGSLHPASESAKPVLIRIVRESIQAQDITAWNDHIDRTPEEVLAAIGRGIEIAERELSETR